LHFISELRGATVMTNSRKRKLGGLIEIGLYACLVLVFLIGCARGEWALVAVPIFAIPFAAFALARVDLIGRSLP
jgi:hypothetical protein